MIYIVGMGPGSPGTITLDAAEVIGRAEIIIGAKRLLESLPEGADGEKFSAVMPDEILGILDEKDPEKRSDDDTDVAVVMSGDTGFYSGTKGLTPALEKAGRKYVVIPGISSVQMLSARLGEPWQDWKLVSAHGKKCDAVSELSQKRKTFFLTGGELKAPDIAKELKDAGLGGMEMTIASDLSYDTERIVDVTSEEASEMDDIPDLAVMLVDRLPEPEVKAYAPGIEDDLFIRGEVPMTKQDVRSAVMGRLSVGPGSTCWDVGAGTGSCTVEMAKMAHGAPVYAVETEAEGCRLIEENKKRFGCWNIRVVQGMAPEALSDLPAPDKVFIGGSKGNMKGIIDAVTGKNRNAEILVSAIAVETIGEAEKELKAHGFDVTVTQIQSSSGRKVAGLNMMIANNPIFLIHGKMKEE